VILAITSAEAKYVAAAYGVVFLVVLLYVAIIALKLARLERELADLTERLAARPAVESERRREVTVG
jgi:CcmD family protein